MSTETNPAVVETPDPSKPDAALLSHGLTALERATADKVFDEIGLLPGKKSTGNEEVKTPTGTELRPYQVEGARSIRNFDGICLLADDPGLGKTIQSFSWIENFGLWV